MKTVAAATAIIATSVAGCANGVNQLVQAERGEARKRVIEQMQDVIPKIKAEHLQMCRDLMAKPDFLGGHYQVVGNFIESIQHSCAAQKTLVLSDIGTTHKTAALVVRLERIDGIGPPSLNRACAFRLHTATSQISVFSSAMQGRSDDICHRITNPELGPQKGT